MTGVIRQDLFAINGDELPYGLYQIAGRKTHVITPLIPQLRLLPVAAAHASSVRVSCGKGSRRPADIQFSQSGSYVCPGDILLSTGNYVRVLLSRNAESNTVLVTERCDNRCLFCSQPPKDNDDEVLLSMAATAIVAFDTSSEVGITGGEPTLYREKLYDFFRTLSTFGNTTPLHILTNGRQFANSTFAAGLAKAAESRPVTLGIPIYATSAEAHDQLVGAKGAWRETMVGLVNGIHAGFGIEVRFIPTAFNIDFLEAVVEMIGRQLPQVAQLSIMNLEPKGWARKNWDTLYISPRDYQEKLAGALALAQAMKVNCRLFNYPLCHLPSALRPYATQSISDWKRIYTDTCKDCRVNSECGGYFSSAKGRFLDQPRAIV